MGAELPKLGIEDQAQALGDLALRRDRGGGDRYGHGGSGLVADEGDAALDALGFGVVA